MARILIIEDEPRIAAFVAKGLRAAGYSTHIESSGIIGAQLAVPADQLRVDQLAQFHQLILVPAQSSASRAGRASSPTPA